VKLVFVGVHGEAAAPFEDLVSGPYRPAALVTMPAEAAREVSGAVDLTGVARAAGVPVFFARNVNDPECVAFIRGIAPDILLVVGWTQLVKEELLAIPKLALGFHASLLPKYRGRAPINWALINGERETGNTLIVLARGADVGDIVAQRPIPIEDDDDCATLYDKVAATEIDMLRQVLPLIAEGRMPRRKQDDAQASVMPKRRPEDGRIDWSRGTRQLYDWVRALTHPYPGAFTSLDGRRVFVWRAALPAPGERVPAPASPGELARDAQGRPWAATADGRLRLVSVQREGEPELEGRDAMASWLSDGMSLR
jgi:methionyl-tRNA formyltransferase